MERLNSWLKQTESPMSKKKKKKKVTWQRCKHGPFVYWAVTLIHCDCSAEFWEFLDIMLAKLKNADKCRSSDKFHSKKRSSRENLYFAVGHRILGISNKFKHMDSLTAKHDNSLFSLGLALEDSFPLSVVSYATFFRYTQSSYPCCTIRNSVNTF